MNHQKNKSIDMLNDTSLRVLKYIDSLVSQDVEDDDDIDFSEAEDKPLSYIGTEHASSHTDSEK